MSFAGSTNSQGNPSGSSRGSHSIEFCLQNGGPTCLSIVGSAGESLSPSDLSSLETVLGLNNCSGTYDSLVCEKNPTINASFAFPITYSHTYNDGTGQSTNDDQGEIPVFTRLAWDNSYRTTLPINVGIIESIPDPLDLSVFRINGTIIEIVHQVAGSASLDIEALSISGNTINLTTPVTSPYDPSSLPNLNIFSANLSSILLSEEGVSPSFAVYSSPTFGISPNHAGFFVSDYTTSQVDYFELIITAHSDASKIGKKFRINITKHNPR